MCGRYNLIDNPAVGVLLDVLGIDLSYTPRLNTRPTDMVPILFQGRSGERRAADATWWLAMNEEEGRLKPDQRWASFNSRADNLVDGKIHKIAPRSFRVILPATGFHEWTNKIPQNITNADTGVLALAGVAKYWKHLNAFSCSIVTLPPHDRFTHIHKKSIPLMLQPGERELWLDNRAPTERFTSWFKTRIPFDLSVTPVNVETLSVTGETELIGADR